ncbi:MAG: M18 family aminopeptidase [Corynebacterium humireducens]|jgi:aspartyl aminopeptidase|uniref:M18 family aminopeptidase n=1 Tax=Corynebacterium humireducens TaxID=1223514 RepID=A0A7X6SUE6_9CORY|nr:M18 family aminopeptidase [Corynebacterium humireducens]
MNQTLDFLDFLAASPSSYHAARVVADRLIDAGFALQDETDPWDAGPGGHVLVRGGAVMAWWVPEDASPDSGFRIIGSHTDSPGFTLKPGPALSSAGWSQANVEVYGGPILASWLDRELTFAGRVVLGDGSVRLVDTGPVARIPHLAIHLDRSKELELDRQQHMQPVLGLVGEGHTPVLDLVAEKAGVEKQDIDGFDLITCDTQPGQVFGADAELIAAGRMDNLTSVHASLVALLHAVESGDTGDDVLVLAAFDHEEVGSASTTGAAGPILEDVLARTAAALGADLDATRRMYARSTCVSADAAHSVHPNYVGKHDPGHHPLIGAGPVVKINANQRYASDAETVARWRRACRAAGVPSQDFVSNNAMPCGSTIGPITATRLGIPTVDVGVPLLGMHSARELAGVQDQLWFAEALEAYLIGS